MTQPEPIAVSVLDSVTGNANHVIMLQITNQTMHGVYIESIQLLEPVNCQVTTIECDNGNIGLDSDVGRFGDVGRFAADKLALPRRIKPMGMVTFEVTIPKIDDVLV